MEQAYLISQGLEEFAAAREQFSRLVNELQSDSTLGMEHGDVEQAISREGNELLRRLFQGHLDVRSAREPKRSEVIGADGEQRTHCRKGCERTLTSLFGMLPLLVIPGPGTELYRGLAAVIVGGLGVSTVFTLVLLPSLLRFGEVSLVVRGRSEAVSSS